MSEVWVLTEGVQVEGMSLVGVFSSWIKVSTRARDLLQSYSPPRDFEMQIDRVRVNSNGPPMSFSAPYHLRYPWKDWI